MSARRLSLAPVVVVANDFEARIGPVSVRTFVLSGARGALLAVSQRGLSSRAEVCGKGETDDDAITAAEAILREDHPRAWEVYAATVLVGADEGASP